MKIGLVELKINEDNYYKYKSFKYCCTKIRDNPCIVFTGEDIVEESDDPSIWNIPKFCIRKEVTQDFWEDTFEYGDEGTTSFHHIQYERYSDCDDCYEVHFTKNGEESTYPDGYISFYKMKRDDYIVEKEKSVNMILKKFMRPNVQGEFCGSIPRDNSKTR